MPFIGSCWSHRENCKCYAQRTTKRQAMIDLNLVPERIPNEPHAYSFRVASQKITALMAKHKAVGVRIGKPMSPKTLQQLRAFHPLAMAFWLSGMHSAPDQFRQTFGLFRYWLKIELGPVTWVDYCDAHIPICKSIADYTISEMTQLLEGLIVMCKESRAYPESERVREIIDGMGDD